MAMTKKEREALEAAKACAALRWTDGAQKDVPPPVGSEESSGYCFNEARGQAYAAWSTSMIHGEGETRSDPYASRGAIGLFSTRLLALKAMRHAAETKAANRLRAIDRMIEDEAGRGSAPAAPPTTED